MREHRFWSSWRNLRERVASGIERLTCQFGSMAAAVLDNFDTLAAVAESISALYFALFEASTALNVDNFGQEFL